MENSNVAEDNLFSYKMYVHFDVFSALVLHRIVRHVNRTDVVTVDDCCLPAKDNVVPEVSCGSNKTRQLHLQLPDIPPLH